MIKRKNIIKVAIDSPAAAGAGTLAKSISKYYNLLYLDTGKIYRLIALIKINQKKFNIHFHNRVSKKILIKHYKKSLASLCLGYDETFCLNAIESMSCGVPVISFKKTSLNRLIKNNINGFKVDNFNQIYEKIIKMINMNNKRRTTLINKTYTYSKKYYFKNIKYKWMKLI